MESINVTPGFLHEVNQSTSHVLDCVLSQAISIVLEYPLYIKFSGEMEVDEGGVQRDIFIAFWKDITVSIFIERST